MAGGGCGARPLALAGGERGIAGSPMGVGSYRLLASGVDFAVGGGGGHGWCVGPSWLARGLRFAVGGWRLGGRRREATSRCEH